MQRFRAVAGRIAACGFAAALAWSPLMAQAAGSDTTFRPIQPVNPGSVLLSGVSAKSSSDAWTVGTQYLNSNTVIATLAEHWNGIAWTVTPTVNPTGNVDILSGVVNISPSNAWAVGSSRPSSGGDRALIEHWNGSRWSQVPSAVSTGFTDEVLNAVTATSASDVWAVGEHFDSTAGGTVGLVEHFNGTAWSIVPSPSTYAYTGSEHVIPGYNSVAAISPTDVWVATNSGVQTGVVEHWNGSAWSVISTPVLTSVNIVAINSLAASSGSDVWAVGGTTGFGRHAPRNQLIEHWNGTSWSIVSGPATPAFSINGVAALSASDAWAVGPQFGTFKPEFEHWDGTSWSNVAVPAATDNFLQFSSAPPSTLLVIGQTQVLLSTNS